MKNRLRKKIKVRGVQWTLRSEKGLTDELGHEVSGICDNRTKTIFVEEGLKPVDFLETLIHEYIHACWFEAGIDDVVHDIVLEHMFINAVAKEMAILSSFWSEWFAWGYKSHKKD